MTAAIQTWKDGFAVDLCYDQLVILRDALARGDESRLLQGLSTAPQPLRGNLDRSIVAADAVVYPHWRYTFGMFGVVETVGAASEAFAACCFNADQYLGEPAACRAFLNFWDDTPREEAFPALLAAVKEVIAERATRILAAARS